MSALNPSSPSIVIWGHCTLQPALSWFRAIPGFLGRSWTQHGNQIFQKIWKIDEHGWKFIHHKRHPLVWSFPGPSGLKITFGPEHDHQLRLHRKSISNPVQQLFPIHVFLSAWRGDQSLNEKGSVTKSARVWFLLPKSAHISTPKSIPIQQGERSKTRWKTFENRGTFENIFHVRKQDEDTPSIVHVQREISLCACQAEWINVDYCLKCRVGTPITVDICRLLV